MNITNDLVTEYINGFYKSQSQDLQQLRIKSEDEKVPIILKETESFLEVLLKIVKPKSILEIGTAVGYSASFFASVCKDCKITTIEKFEEKADIAKGNIKNLGYEKEITVLTGDGEDIINSLDENMKFDFVFIDAAKSHYKRFLDASMKHISKDGVIVCDNVLFKARTASDQYDPTGKYKTNIRNMREFIKYITDHPALDTTIISCGDGLSISKLRSENE